jgi:hypothetical protein
MGRIRKTLRWTFSFGGTGAGSPIRAESSAERAAREHADLMREQNRLLAEQNRLVSQAARPVRTGGQARCPSCKKPIQAAPAGSRVPFVHTDTGDFAC